VSHAAASGVMESAFEETKPYVLTELGKQFVHYVMGDVVPQRAVNPEEDSGPYCILLNTNQLRQCLQVPRMRSASACTDVGCVRH